MSRCGSCPIYECSKAGVDCPGDLGIEECADKLQHLYWNMSQDNEANKTHVDDARITDKRAIDLINALIEHMINEAGGHAREVIEVLLDVGFTSDELVDEFLFTRSDVEDCLEEDGEESDKEE